MCRLEDSETADDEPSSHERCVDFEAYLQEARLRHKKEILALRNLGISVTCREFSKKIM